MINNFPVLEFYKGYVDLAGDGDLVPLLEKNRDEMLTLFIEITDQKMGFRYEKGKWSVKEVIQHITDTERIMTYRALRISRGDQTPLPGFEQDDYVNALKIDHLGKKELINEWQSVREASLSFFRNIDPSLLTLEGTANGKKVNVELQGRIIVGHTRHHTKILKERYKV